MTFGALKACGLFRLASDDSALDRFQKKADFAVMIDFWKWRVSNEDPTKMVSLSSCPVGVCAARVTCEDIRHEFGIRVSNDILYDLATTREANRRTLSEIATSLFEAGKAKLYRWCRWRPDHAGFDSRVDL
jgi:hypothetical protein